MPLIDALLLDPVPVLAWIAVRTDGIKGSGTFNDPYDGSTAARFDSVMRSMTPGSGVHLGPGTFTTAGYSDSAPGSGWQIQPGMKISGSGIGVTILKLDPAADQANKHFFAIGHALNDGNFFPSPTPVDLADVSELTIDCNLRADLACGAIRLMGNHVRVRNVRAINWGTRWTDNPCFVFSLIMGTRTAGNYGTVNAGMEGCIADMPSGDNTGVVSVLHLGGTAPGSAELEAVGMVPFIRNCSVDCVNLTHPFGHDIRALSINRCKGGVIEGNLVQNTKIGGPYLESSSCRDIVVRNNTFRNVARGPFWKVGTLDTLLRGAISTLDVDSTVTNYIAALATTVKADHGLLVGDRVKIDVPETNSSYEGVFVVTAKPALNKFNYAMLSNPGPPAGDPKSWQKVFGFSNFIIEKNTIELATGSDGKMGIHIDDGKADNSTNSDTPDYDSLDVIIRENRIRYVDGKIGGRYAGSGIKVSGVKDVIVQENVLELDPSPSIQDFRCGSVRYLDNRNLPLPTLDGLVPEADRFHPDLEVPSEEAFAYANLDK